MKRLPQLGDLQLLVGDQRLVRVGASAAGCHFRLKRVDVVRQEFGIGGHDMISGWEEAPCRRGRGRSRQPARAGKVSPIDDDERRGCRKGG